MNALQHAVKEFKKYRILRNEASARNDFHSRDLAGEELQYWKKVLDQYEEEAVKAAMNDN